MSPKKENSDLFFEFILFTIEKKSIAIGILSYQFLILPKSKI
jgi:hypothetical protein